MQYRIFYKPMLQEGDGRFFAVGWRSTSITVKAQNETSAERKAKKVWEKAQYGPAELKLVQEA